VGVAAERQSDEQIISVCISQLKYVLQMDVMVLEGNHTFPYIASQD
jgi:hypothetical protein